MPAPKPHVRKKNLPLPLNKKTKFGEKAIEFKLKNKVIKMEVLPEDNV